MPRFEYTALDARGAESQGVVEASSQNDVVAQLRQQGFFPTSVAPEGQAKKPAKAGKAAAKTAVVARSSEKKGFTLFKRKTIPTKTLMIFTRQLATLIDAGLPLLKGLNVLAKQEKDPVLRESIVAIAESVQGGSTFSEAMGQHPRIFQRLYVSMVKAGEIGGVLELVLTRLAEFQEKAQKLKNKIKSAMTYPVVVLVIALLILVFLLTTIVPKFAQIFKDMLGESEKLPALTLWVMATSDFVKGMFVPPNLWFTLIAIGAIGGGWWSLNNTEKGREFLDRMKLRLPIFGDISRKGAIARFTRTLGTLVTSGVPILQALNITKETAGNVVLADAITKVHDAVKEGESIVSPLEASGVFPPMVISMVDVGEETGQLPEMLLKVAEVYDDEVDNAVESLTSLLEPIMIVFLAFIVGTIVIALFLPLIKIIEKMQTQHELRIRWPRRGKRIFSDHEKDPHIRVHAARNADGARDHRRPRRPGAVGRRLRAKEERAFAGGRGNRDAQLRVRELQVRQRQLPAGRSHQRHQCDGRDFAQDRFHTDDHEILGLLALPLQGAHR